MDTAKQVKKTFLLTVNAQMHAWIKKAAHRHETSMLEYLRRLVRSEMQKKEDKRQQKLPF